MLGIRFEGYRRRVGRHSSSVYALLAAIVLDAVLVVSLLHIALRPQRGPESQRAATIEPSQHVNFVTVSAVNEIHPTKDAITKDVDGVSRERTLSRSPDAAVSGSRTTPTDTIVPSLELSRQKSRQAFQAVMPGIVERTRAEVIDSIIERGIQPGNDSAARMRLARRYAVDWTVHIRGESFGMSPGQVHLGKISIRVPLVFAEPLSLDADRRRLARGMNEDARLNAARAARDAAFDSAVASIRLRKSGERLARTGVRIPQLP